ncbi:MAG: N-acetylmuramoyl-L-alanine amidase [Alphaproteobacteria bacterium]|nr:MAG: N-acetylmuramoyl-L-alanine amidase [Alphaproteobacteria bacterium]
MEFIQAKHYRKGRKSKVDTLVLHYFSVVSIDKNNPFNLPVIKDWLANGVPDNGTVVKVSTHYLIGRDGDVIQFVDEKDTAWHAGVSNLNGRAINGSCNDFSIGIELVGGQWVAFTDKQYESLIGLTKGIIKRNPEITKETIVGHEEIAVGRKIDPGKMFDWVKYFNGVFEESQPLTATPIPLFPKVSNITSGQDSTIIEKLKNLLKRMLK